MLERIKRNSKNLLGMALAFLLLPVTMIPIFAINPAEIPADQWIQNPANGQTSAYNIETMYAGVVSHKDYHDKVITDRYGATAKDLYVQGLRTGDMVPFRTQIGDFKKGLSSWMNDGYNNLTLDNAEGIMNAAMAWLGPYATAQDYIAWAKGLGYDPMSAPSRSQLAAAIALKQVAEPAYITKAQYQANHKAGAVAAPAASNSSVEALKSYAGNNDEFNAYQYYMRYADLQAAFGANGDLLLKHYNEHGKAEGRNAK